MRYLAVFKGRSGCLKCLHTLSDLGIPSRVVNTPRETGYGCGISLEVPPAYYARAVAVCVAADGFRGWWTISDSGNAITRL